MRHASEAAGGKRYGSKLDGAAGSTAVAGAGRQAGSRHHPPATLRRPEAGTAAALGAQITSSQEGSGDSIWGPVRRKAFMMPRTPAGAAQVGGGALRGAAAGEVGGQPTPKQAGAESSKQQASKVCRLEATRTQQ